MNRTTRALSLLLALVVLAAGCGSDDDDGGGAAAPDTTAGTDGTDGGSESPTTAAPEDDAIDYEAIGLWDDGPCDESLDPLRIGLITVFSSPVLSLEDQALSLEAAAEAFNQRGGANGACIEVVTCDDGANLDQAIGCVREIDEAGVVATVNDQNSTGAAEVSAAMSEAGIPRVAYATSSMDWGDQNAYPLDGAGFGVVFLLPQALIESGASEIALVRVDIASASSLITLLADLYADTGASFPLDVPVPGGTTDYTQFILAAEAAGADAISIALGEQEAVQIIKAAQQLESDLLIGSSLGTFPHSSVSGLGDFAEKMVFLWSFPPATTDLPVYEVLRQDLAASGEDALQPENLKASPMRSWIGLYGLLWMIRDTGMTEFTREGISAMLKEATDVPMLGIFGEDDWTPNTNHPGIYQRAGMDRWQTFSWDPNAEAPDGLTGNFVAEHTISLDAVMCGSPFGAPEPC